jgi:tRNA(fMet)-specific endonuclease VapC
LGQLVGTSIIAAAELRYGAPKRGSARLTGQIEALLGGLNVLALESPVDVVRTGLERSGRSIGANDLLIAAHALTLGHPIVTDNEREFSRVDDLVIENWLG